jgi:DNA-binding transcriptional LysR family regulator
MRESYDQGIASQAGPESCVAAREGVSKALTGQVQVRGRVLSREIHDPLRVPFSGGTDSAFAPARLTEGLIVVDNGNDASLPPADPVDQTHVGHRPIHGLNDSGPDGRRLDRRSLIQIDVGRGRLAQRGEQIESHAMIDLVAAGPGFALVPSSVQECQKTHIVCRRLDPAAPELDLSLAFGPWWGVSGDQCPARAGSFGRGHL